jgi:anti-sigma factor (TIGR02949 family)
MTEHKNCSHLLSSLSDFVDGELSDDLCQEIESHMAGCENCQIVVNTLQKTVDLFRKTSEKPEIPPDVKDRLIKRLELEEFLEK